LAIGKGEEMRNRFGYVIPTGEGREGLDLGSE
jgi:hypothetical protein